MRSDKPQPYVQHIVDGRVAHQTVTTGATGEREGVTLIEVQGLGVLKNRVVFRH